MDSIFDEIIDLPDPRLDRQYENLVGLDDTKAALAKQAALLLSPGLLDAWSEEYHGAVIPAVERFHHRPPLILFEGDVGTGKTSLAESFGSSIARTEKISIKVMHLSLTARGRGAVGEMTQLITKAFDAVVTEIGSADVGSGSKPGRAVILVIDEADALAQSREFEQMHHEDRAGVNALIRGIDRLTNRDLPVLVVMCTNRVGSIDPAILRRAAARFSFARPNETQRRQVFEDHFASTLDDADLEKLVEVTGPNDQRSDGYTFSDLTQRLIPGILLAAYPDRPVDIGLAVEVISRIAPTEPFREDKVDEQA